MPVLAESDWNFPPAEERCPAALGTGSSRLHCANARFSDEQPVSRPCDALLWFGGYGRSGTGQLQLRSKASQASAASESIGNRRSHPRPGPPPARRNFEPAGLLRPAGNRKAWVALGRLVDNLHTALLESRDDDSHLQEVPDATDQQFVALLERATH